MTQSLRVPVKVQFLDDESLQGYLIRVAQENMFPSANVLHELFGMDSKGLFTKMVDASRNTLEISRLLGVPETRLIDLLPRPLEDDPSTFLTRGMELKQHFFARSFRRISPKSLQISPHHRFSWQLADVSYCRESWQILIDKCPAAGCGAHLGWSSTLGIHICERCGYDLRNAPANEVRSEDRGPLQLVADIVSNDELQNKRALLQLHPSLQHLNRGTLLQLVNVFGRLHASMSGIQNIKSLKYSLDYPDLTVAGARILRACPASIVEIAERDPDPCSMTVFARLTEICKTGLSQQTIAFLRQMIAEIRPIARSTVRGLALVRQERDRMTLRDVATELRIENSAVRRLVKVGALRPEHIRGKKREIDWFDRQQVLQLGAAMRDRIATDEIHSLLRLPSTAVEQLVMDGILRWHPSPGVSAAFTTPCLLKSEFQEFQQRLQETITHQGLPGSSRMTLSECFALTGPGPKPWALLLRAALSRSLPGGLGQIKPSRAYAASNLTIERDAFFQIMRGIGAIRFADEPGRPSCSGLEAEERLCVNPADIAELARAGHLKRFAGSHKRFCRESVLTAVETFIGAREIAARLGMEPQHVAGWARRWRIKKPDNLTLWRREDIEPFLPKPPFSPRHSANGGRPTSADKMGGHGEDTDAEPVAA